MLTVEKRERQNSSRNCLPKRVMNNAFAGVTNCFYSFGMFVRNSSREKFKDLYYFTWVSLGSWRRKLEFSDIWPYLSTFGHLAVFKHFRTSGHQLQNFHCHFHFLPRSLKNSQSQNAKCYSSQTKLHCTRVAWIFGCKHLIMSIFW